MCTRHISYRVEFQGEQSVSHNCFKRHC
jgi:hypothetical protein